MARVLVAKQAWGVQFRTVGDRAHVWQNLACTIDTTVYDAATGSTPVSSFATNTDGELPGWVEEGTYNLTVNGVPKEVSTTSEARTDSLESTRVLIKEAPINVMSPPAGFAAAVGDGVTDDTAAIQALMTFLYNTDGGDIFLPPRKSFAVSQLALYFNKTSTVNIRGGGKRSAFLKKFGATTTPLIKYETNPVTQIESYSDFSNFSILGTSKLHDGIEFDCVARFRIDNVDIRSCNRAINNKGGLIFEMASCSLISNNTGLRNVLSAQVGGPPPNLITIAGSVIAGNTSRGIDHGSGQMLVLCDGTDIELNGTVGDQTTGGLYVQSDVTTAVGFAQIVIRDTWFESNKGWTIQAYGGDLIMDAVNLLSHDSGRAVKAVGLRLLQMTDCHAPTVGDTISVDATTSLAHFKRGVLNVITSASPGTQIESVAQNARAGSYTDLSGDLSFLKPASILARNQAAGTSLLAARVPGDTDDRIRIETSGVIRRGSGATGADVIDMVGTGSPETVVTAAPGSTFRRRDGGPGAIFYIKDSGFAATGWRAL